jgi:hypothetical protein
VNYLDRLRRGLHLDSAPKAEKNYGWSHNQGENDAGERLVTVLEIPPVESTETAVKMAIAAKLTGKT